MYRKPERMGSRAKRSRHIPRHLFSVIAVPLYKQKRTPRQNIFCPGPLPKKRTGAENRSFHSVPQGRMPKKTSVYAQTEKTCFYGNSASASV